LAELDDKSRLLPGADNSRGDVLPVVKYLAEAGYDGPVTPKPSRGLFQTRRRDLVVKQTGEAMERVWRAAGLVSERRFVPTAAPVND
jgi:hypothetical protein